MRKIFALMAIAVLTSCGADGAPERPTTGVTVTGEARMGVVMN